MPSVYPPPASAYVYKTEEKGSDVNLAVDLVRDALTDQIDLALVYSNDSDLEAAFRVVRQDAHKMIGLVNTANRRPSIALKKYHHFYHKIRTGHLAHHQLPNPIPDTNISKPQDWSMT